MDKYEISSAINACIDKLKMCARPQETTELEMLREFESIIDATLEALCLPVLDVVTVQEDADDAADHIQTMGEVLSEVCHTLLSPRDDGNFNVTGRMPSHSMVSFSPRTSAYVREALRPANDPLRGGDDG